jgi:hypothetical protein
LRIVHIKTLPYEYEAAAGLFKFTIDKEQYNYGQVILGTRYWFSRHWLASLEASSLFSLSSDLHIKNNIFAGAAFGYRF